MFQKRTLLFIIGLLFFMSVWAESFVVVSNADSGPGTLREALQNAASNGATSQDIITFNISDQSLSGRTINLQSELPAVTGNLVIDGSSQPSSSIGITGARIILQLNKFIADFCFLTIKNVSDVEIYGLCFFKPSSINSIETTSIYFNKCKNLTIGKPGKGNYFVGTYMAISSRINKLTESYTSTDTSSFLSVQSNIFGLSSNGDTRDLSNIFQNTSFDVNVFGLFLINVYNVQIGGSQSSEGNSIFAATSIYYDTDISTGNGYLNIKGNNIGLNYQGIFDAPVGKTPTPSKIVITPRSSDARLEMKNNNIGGEIAVEGLTSDAYIQSNKIIGTNTAGIGDTERQNYPQFRTVRLIASVNTIFFGGDNPSDGNDISLFKYDLSGGLVGEIGLGASYTGLAGTGVLIRNNSLHCNTSEGSGMVSGPQLLPINYTNENSIAWVRIDSTGNNFVRGQAAANSRIDLYLDDECRACEGKQMIGTTIAASDGSWNFTGNFTGVVVATSKLNQNNHTRGFSIPQIYSNNVKIQYPTCGKSNGSIKGLVMSGGDNCEWRYSPDADFSHSVMIATTLEISDLKAGYYWVMAKLGNTCYGWKAIFHMPDYTPVVRSQKVRITNTTCGSANGSIKGITVDFSNYCRLEWRNSAGTVVGTSLDLINILPGNYKFFAIDTILGGGCIDSSTIFSVGNQLGPSVNINTVLLTNASCGNSNGSIINMQISNATGALYFRWEDSSHNLVGNSVDLTNVKAGFYRLKFKDGGACDTITTPFFTINNTGLIEVDSNAIKIKPSACDNNNGGISNMKITGGSSYEWRSLTSGLIISTTIDIGGLGPGNYQLLIKNNFGCSLLLPVMSVPSATFIPLNVTGYVVKDATCELDNGIIHHLTYDGRSSGYSFEWINGTGLRMGTTDSLANLPADVYRLFASDSNKCIKEIFTTNIKRIPKPVFDSSLLNITNDSCNQSQGSIKLLKLKNLAGPTAFEWIDGTGQIAGIGNDLSSVKSGTYSLKVTDAYTCILSSKPFMIRDEQVKQPDPVYVDTIIARNSPAYLYVKNFNPGNYFLYNSSGSTIPLMQNTSGNFTLTSLSADSDFYIEYKKGSCYSSRVKVSIKVVDETILSIPNSFSPNNDGINDFFNIRVTGFFTLKELRIYTRAGNEIFSTTSISRLWDGRLNGKNVPAGTYYYILKGSDIYGKPILRTGSITVLY